MDSLVTVPAPAAVWLFGTALLGLIGRARRRGLASHAGRERVPAPGPSIRMPAM